MTVRVGQASRLSICLAALVACALAFAADLTQEQAIMVKASLKGQVADLLARYQTWDCLHKDGKGNSDAKTSGGFGWGEAGFLRDYVHCFRVSEDPYWLDKIIDHFDRMIANMRENPEGFMAWDDPAYSVNVIEAKPVGDVGEATIEPESQRLWRRRGKPDVTGHEYEIIFPAADRFLLKDLTEDKEVASGEYTGELVIEALAPGKLTIKGEVKAGARFEVKTLAPQRCEYQVHDGMVTYRIAQFIEAVLKSPELREKYGAKAEEYLRILDRDFLQKWEATWADLPAGAGLYKFTKNPTQRFPNYSLPHNQFLALARTWLVLADVPGYENADLCRKRATGMAKYFKQNLRIVNDAYEWHYWDPLPEEEGVGRHVEDFSHATIDIGFAVEAAARGIVFGEEDLERFARTYVDVMWNGDKEKPRFGSRVDTNEGDKSAWADWIELAVADVRVWEVAFGLFESQKRPIGMIASVLEVYRRLVGIDEEERAACRARTGELESLEGVLLPNPGFEMGDGTSALAWQSAIWSGGSKGSEFKRVKPGHSGEWAMALIGRGEKINLVMTGRRIPVQGHKSARVSAWYRTEAGARPHFSIIASDKDGERLQYDNSPTFEASDTWRQATHEFPLKPGVVGFELILRNGAVGTVCYDDVELELVE